MQFDILPYVEDMAKSEKGMNRILIIEGSRHTNTYSQNKAHVNSWLGNDPLHTMKGITAYDMVCEDDDVMEHWFQRVDYLDIISALKDYANENPLSKDELYDRIRYIVYVTNRPNMVAAFPTRADLETAVVLKIIADSTMLTANYCLLDVLAVGPMDFYSRSVDETTHPEASRIITGALISEEQEEALARINFPLTMLVMRPKSNIVKFRDKGFYDLEESRLGGR